MLPFLLNGLAVRLNQKNDDPIPVYTIGQHYESKEIMQSFKRLIWDCNC